MTHLSAQNIAVVEARIEGLTFREIGERIGRAASQNYRRGVRACVRVLAGSLRESAPASQSQRTLTKKRKAKLAAVVGELFVGSDWMSVSTDAWEERGDAPWSKL